MIISVIRIVKGSITLGFYVCFPLFTFYVLSSSLSASWSTRDSAKYTKKNPCSNDTMASITSRILLIEKFLMSHRSSIVCVVFYFMRLQFVTFTLVADLSPLTWVTSHRILVTIYRLLRWKQLPAQVHYTLNDSSLLNSLSYLTGRLRRNVAVWWRPQLAKLLGIWYKLYMQVHIHIRVCFM